MSYRHCSPCRHATWNHHCNSVPTLKQCSQDLKPAHNCPERKLACLTVHNLVREIGTKYDVKIDSVKIDNNISDYFYVAESLRNERLVFSVGLKHPQAKVHLNDVEKVRDFLTSWLNKQKGEHTMPKQTRTIPTKEQVLEAANRCPQTKEALKILFPEDFKIEEAVPYNIYQRLDGCYKGDFYICLYNTHGTLDLLSLTIPGEWWGDVSEMAGFKRVDNIPRGNTLE